MRLALRWILKMIKKIRELCLFNREKIRKQICFDELDNLLFNLRFMQSKSLKEIYPEAPVDERTRLAYIDRKKSHRYY